MKKFWVFCSIMLVFAFQKSVMGFTLQPLAVCEPYPRVVFMTNQPVADCTIILQNVETNVNFTSNYILPAPTQISITSNGSMIYVYSFDLGQIPNIISITPYQNHKLSVLSTTNSEIYYATNYFYDPMGQFGVVMFCGYISNLVSQIENSILGISENDIATLVELHLSTVLYSTYNIDYSQIQNCLADENRVNIFAAKRCCQVFNPNRLYCSECNEDGE